MCHATDVALCPLRDMPAGCRNCVPLRQIRDALIVAQIAACDRFWPAWRSREWLAISTEFRPIVTLDELREERASGTAPRRRLDHPAGQP